jgi:hypothetical protein
MGVSRFFSHSLPPRHVDFGFWTVAFPSVESVTATDPLTDAVSRVLCIPLRELYAVLWRFGVVEIDD